jgi:hypothetical protein
MSRFDQRMSVEPKSPNPATKIKPLLRQRMDTSYWKQLKRLLALFTDYRYDPFMQAFEKGLKSFIFFQPHL